MRFIWVALVTAILASCGRGPKEPEVHYPDEATVLTVRGMHCSACKASIIKALANVEGVEWAQIEVEAGQVAYLGPAQKTGVVAAIQGVGYEVGE